MQIVRAWRGIAMSLLGENLWKSGWTGMATSHSWNQVGVDEIDILAIRPCPVRQVRVRHIESKSRSTQLLYKGAAAIRKQTASAYNSEEARCAQLKAALMNGSRQFNCLAGGSWRNSFARVRVKELVVGSIKHEEALDLLRQRESNPPLKTFYRRWSRNEGVKAAAGADLFDLMLLRK